jgi:hypothetical protein
MLPSFQLALHIKSALQFYRRSLYVVVPFSASVGFSAGLVENFTADTKLTPLQVFTNVIGYTTLGVATGVTYPLTFPVIMHSVLI